MNKLLQLDLRKVLPNSFWKFMDNLAPTGYSLEDFDPEKFGIEFTSYETRHEDIPYIERWANPEWATKWFETFVEETKTRTLIPFAFAEYDRYVFAFRLNSKTMKVRDIVLKNMDTGEIIVLQKEADFEHFVEQGLCRYNQEDQEVDHNGHLLNPGEYLG